MQKIYHVINCFNYLNPFLYAHPLLEGKHTRYQVILHSGKTATDGLKSSGK